MFDRYEALLLYGTLATKICNSFSAKRLPMHILRP